MVTTIAGGGGGVQVVGLGAQTPVGRTAPESAAAVRAGISRFSEHPFMTDVAGEHMRVACVPWLSPLLPLGARIQALVLGAAKEAVAPLLAAIAESRRPVPVVGAIIGVTDNRPGLSPRWRQELADGLLQSLSEHFPAVKLEFRASGHAAGVAAMERGCQLLIEDEVDFCLVGGGDSHLGPENLLQLEAQEQVRGDDNPWGFIPGEAGGACLLATKATARRYGLASLLEVSSVALAKESNTARSRTVCTGTGLSQAVAQVLKSCRATQVDVIISDQNGETYRADEFGFTLARHARRFTAPPNTRTPATAWGDVGAASVPLFAALVAASGQRGYAAGEYGLLIASSETCERGAVLVRLESFPPK